jgi:hypothetical protein
LLAICYIFYIYCTMKFKFLTPKDNVGIVKATVHKTGKMGFSTGAIKVLGLDKNKYFKLALNEDDENDTNLYLVLAKESDKDTFVTNKAGPYYYIKIKHVLDELGVDYKSETIIYDIREVKDSEVKCYKLSRRKSTSKKQQNV